MNPNERTSAPSRWTRQDTLLVLFNLVVFAAYMLLFNDRLPDRVSIHFNVNGEADRDAAKSTFWLINLALAVLLPASLTWARQFDPRRENYAKFAGYYVLIRWVISLFIQSVLLLVILYNLGYDLPMTSIILGGIGLLWIVIGNRMGQLRSNYFIGIRTPWALTSDDNWRRTHRLAAKTWFAAGLLMFLSAFAAPTSWVIVVTLACALLSAAIPAAYSFLLYSRVRRG